MIFGFFSMRYPPIFPSQADQSPGSLAAPCQAWEHYNDLEPRRSFLGGNYRKYLQKISKIMGYSFHSQTIPTYSNYSNCILYDGL